MAKRVSESIRAAVANKGLAFLPFLPGGFPDLPLFSSALRALGDCGADCIEIGFPFSDPIADGPTIQAAFADALQRGVKVNDIFTAVANVRPYLPIPLVAMVSHSIVYRFGVERFITSAKASGFDGILIPDLPPPEAQPTCAAITASGLETVLLVAPTTSPPRRRQIASLCSGFVYYLSVSGITGARAALPDDLATNVSELRAMSPAPVCVGFGISQPSHLAQLRGVADGAIVGSALVKAIGQCVDPTPSVLAHTIEACCRELLSLVR